MGMTWRERRIERRLIRAERALRNLDKHASWEASFDRWGPAQERKYDRDRAALVERIEQLNAALDLDEKDMAS